MALMKKKFCPQCGSEDVELIDSNDRWMCAECGFTGKFPEHAVALGRDVDDEEVQEVDPDAEYLRYKSKSRTMEEDEDEEAEELELDMPVKKAKTGKPVSKTIRTTGKVKKSVKKTVKKTAKKTTRRKK